MTGITMTIVSMSDMNTSKIRLTQEEWDKKKNRIRDDIEQYTRTHWEIFFDTYTLTEYNIGKR